MAVTAKSLGQLQALLTSAVVVGISVLDAQTPTLRLDWAPGATDGQKTTANAQVAAFDWSPAAEGDRQDALEPDMAAFRDASAAAITTLTTYIDLATPTAGQRSAVVDRMVVYMRAIIRHDKRLATKLGMI